MQIFVKFDDVVRSLDLPAEATVGMMKQMVALDDDLMLAAGSTILDNDNSVVDLENGSTVYALPRLLGGKVHGSLARAGKVRAQTPKVDKQDKKKKKQGRAARRIQYTRRFLNVATGPGKKRGPNSNS